MEDLEFYTTAEANDYGSEAAFKRELIDLQSQAFNFGVWGIKDASVRRDYQKRIKEASDDYIRLVRNRQLTFEKGAEEVRKVRNQIMENMRGKSSHIGESVAEYLKPTGETLDSLCKRKSLELFKKEFNQLDTIRKNKVYLRIVYNARNDRRMVRLIMPIVSKAGKGLVLYSFSVSVYNIYTAKDKLHAIKREGVSLGGGFVGGMAGGAAAGLVCGPGAPVCVTIGAFVGGVMGAWGAESLLN